MNSNYDGTSAGQKTAQYAALHELYCRWNAAPQSTPKSRPRLTNWLGLAAIIGTVGTLFIVVVAICWPRL